MYMTLALMGISCVYIYRFIRYLYLSLGFDTCILQELVLSNGGQPRFWLPIIDSGPMWKEEPRHTGIGAPQYCMLLGQHVRLRAESTIYIYIAYTAVRVNEVNGAGNKRTLLQICERGLHRNRVRSRSLILEQTPSVCSYIPAGIYVSIYIYIVIGIDLVDGGIQYSITITIYYHYYIYREFNEHGIQRHVDCIPRRHLCPSVSSIYSALFSASIAPLV